MKMGKIRSVRLLVEKIGVIGSGFLFVPPGSKSYIFTAAHVIENREKQTILLECYHEEDLLDECNISEEEYIFRVSGSEFAVHCKYSENRSKDFNGYDIAGIEIDKRPWMESIGAFELVPPVGEMPVYVVGYPYTSHAEDIEFSYREFHTFIRQCSQKRRRMQISLQGNMDMTDLGDELQGMSGAAIYGLPETDGKYVCALWKSGQGKNVSGGIINAVTELSIRDLCQQEGWQSPRSNVILSRTVENISGSGEKKKYFYVDKSNAEYSVMDTKQSSLILKQYREDLHSDLADILHCIRNLSIEKALEKCNDLAEKIQYLDGYQKEKGIIDIYRAKCYLILGECGVVKDLLCSTERFESEERARALMMLAELSLREGDLEKAEEYVSLAVKCKGEAVQTRNYKIYLQTLQNKEVNLQTVFEELEEQQNIKTPKEWMQIYQIEGNLYREKQGDILRAVSCYKKAYSVDGEKSLLLCIAINYRQYAVSNLGEIDLPFMDLAIQYFDMYLNEADDMVKRHFYKECGIAYINDCVLIGAFSSVLANIDGVLRQCKDPHAICDLRIVRANAAVELGCADPEVFTGISSWIRDSMLLHHECKMLGTRWTEYMDDKYSIEYDVEYTGRTDLKCLARVEEKGKQLEKEYRMLADKLKLLLGNPESDARYARPIYADLLDMFLILKSGDEFKEYLSWAEKLYPYDCGIYVYERYISEAEGDYAAAESEIRKCLDQQFTLKTTKDALSFYTRNGKYHRIRELYKTILDSESDVGRYQRDVLILQYILYLTRPTANWLFALEEYLKYESEMEDDNFRQILEMKFRRYTNNYGEYEKWINISVFWMQTAPGKAEFQDAILLSVFNLKENDAKFYIELFRKQFESNTDENEIRSYFAPYFDLTGDNQCDEGQVSSLNFPKLDRQIECSRSLVYPNTVTGTIKIS